MAALRWDGLPCTPIDMYSRAGSIARVLVVKHGLEAGNIEAHAPLRAPFIPKILGSCLAVTKHKDLRGCQEVWHRVARFHNASRHVP